MGDNQLATKGSEYPRGEITQVRSFTDYLPEGVEAAFEGAGWSRKKGIRLLADLAEDPTEKGSDRISAIKTLDDMMQKALGELSVRTRATTSRVLEDGTTQTIEADGNLSLIRGNAARTAEMMRTAVANRGDSVRVKRDNSGSSDNQPSPDAISGPERDVFGGVPEPSGETGRPKSGGPSDIHATRAQAHLPRRSGTSPNFGVFFEDGLLGSKGGKPAGESGGPDNPLESLIDAATGPTPGSSGTGN